MMARAMTAHGAGGLAWLVTVMTPDGNRMLDSPESSRIRKWSKRTVPRRAACASEPGSSSRRPQDGRAYPRQSTTSRRGWGARRQRGYKIQKGLRDFGASEATYCSFTN
jgi:hypothetical protein